MDPIGRVICVQQVLVGRARRHLDAAQSDRALEIVSRLRHRPDAILSVPSGLTDTLRTGPVATIPSMPSPARTVTVVALVAAAGVAGVLGATWTVDQFRSPVCEFTAAGTTESFTPEQSANAATISMITVQRGLAPRAATIGIATAIQESKLVNINYGDADSLGLFQQRPSQGWGSEEQVTDPVYSANAFYDALVEVEGWESGVVTEVAQEVQRSAFPTAYADHEPEARVLASVLTGETPAGVGCRLDDPTQAGSPAETSTKASNYFGYSSVADGNTLTFEAATTTEAWAVASWGVTHADAEDITAVLVDGQAWRRDSDPLNWLGDGAAPTSSGTVVFEFAT